eukprot:TRINITY_DN2249_c0_g2_i1.p2 TRINITY_DN2249_c0_g2~~TRINITY_DN2249_c0_g2_i1.p2  ORF type:complete len:274 (+),score=49.82 TRINITY_DN2249_c0_g2_i1:72-824(+)
MRELAAGGEALAGGGGPGSPREFIRLKRLHLMHLCAAACGTGEDWGAGPSAVPAPADAPASPPERSPPTAPRSPPSTPTAGGQPLSETAGCGVDSDLQETLLLRDIRRLQGWLACRETGGGPSAAVLRRALGSDDDRLRAAHPALRSRPSGSGHCRQRRHPRDDSAGAPPAASYAALFVRGGAAHPTPPAAPRAVCPVPRAASAPAKAPRQPKGTAAAAPAPSPKWGWSRRRTVLKELRGDYPHLIAATG